MNAKEGVQIFIIVFLQCELYHFLLHDSLQDDG